MSNARFLHIDDIMHPISLSDPDVCEDILNTCRNIANRKRGTDPDLEACLSDFDEIPGYIAHTEILAWDAQRSAEEDLEERDGPFALMCEVA